MTMYKIAVPRSRKNIIDLMDSLIDLREIELPDIKTNRSLGHYIKPWRDKGFISLYNEDTQRKTLCKLNIPGVERKDGRSVIYAFDDSILDSALRIKFPGI
ncbi:MAG TPA: hypothetical protein VMY59_08940 [Candidatus Thermoplasmatota archaeon]|nr:hypothetical protein [Candidatus Thermoplasmatota archaeon]